MAGYDDDGNMLATPAAKRRGRCLVYETDDAGLYVSSGCICHKGGLAIIDRLLAAQRSIVWRGRPSST